MKKITKLLSIILAIVLIVQIVPFSAFAQEPEQVSEQEQISVTLPDEGGYVEGLPEELEEEPEGDLELETLEEPVFFRDGNMVGIYNPNSGTETKYKIDNGTWLDYSEPFYLPAYSSASVSAKAVDEDLNEAVKTSNFDSRFERNFWYTEAVTDFTLNYKTVSFDFSRIYQNQSWTFSIESGVITSNSAVFTAYLPDGSIIPFVKVTETEYQSPSLGYVLRVIKENNVVTGYNIEIGNLIYKCGTDGYLYQIESVYGDAITITRNNLTVLISDGANRTYTVLLSESNGMPLSVTDPAGGVIYYTYTSGKLATVTDQAGKVIGNYQYTSGKLTKSSDKTISYDSSNRVTQVLYDSGAFEQYTYNNTANSVTVTTSTDNVNTTVYNDAAEIVSTVDESGYTSAYTYDSDYNMLTETINGELYTTNTYNSSGLLATTTDADNVTVTYTYNTDGRLIEEASTDSEEITRYTYTEEGELSKTATLKEETVSYIGEGGETIEALEWVEQGSVTYTYDDGMLVQTVDSESNETIAYTYDNYGNAITTTVTVSGNNSSTAQTTATYDILGRNLTSSDGTDTTTYVYDAAGRTLKVTSGDDVTRTVYDSQGRVVQVISSEDYDSSCDGLPNSDTYSNSNVGTRYVYASNGTLTSETDRLGRVTTYTYNSVGSRVQESFDIYCYYYLNHGEKYRTTIAGQNYLICTYSNDGKYRLITESYSNGDEINYEYDSAGNLIYQLDENDNVLFEFSYDNNELTEKIDYQRGLTFSYENDNVEVRKTSDNSLLYSYTNTTPEPLEGEEVSETTFTESHFGTTLTGVNSENLTSYTLGNNTSSFEDTLDNSGRITSSSVKYNNNSVTSFAYTYDSNENITSKSVQIEGQTAAFEYEYDSEDRIVSEEFMGDDWTENTYDSNGQVVRTTNKAFGMSYTYSYDSRGNITSKKLYQSAAADLSNLTPAMQTDFTYQSTGWTDKLTEVRKAAPYNGALYDYEINAITYDNIGNVLTYGNKTFTWENGRNLTQITDGNNTYSYTYDEDGLRTSKTVNGVTTYFTYSGGQLLSQSDGTNTFIFQYDASGNPSGFIYNGTQYYYVTNAMGDVYFILDTQGTAVASYLNLDTTWGAADTNAFSLSAIGRLNPIRFKGYYLDTETGYYYLQSRYYNPDICRFINADKYCDTGTGTVYSRNMFAYCENDPVNYDDPSGEYYYNRKEAVNYAHNHCYSPNPNYYLYSQDCTNFVSQCLYAGGFKKSNTWHSYSSWKSDLKCPANVDKITKKFLRYWDISAAWRLAKNNYNYFSQSYIAIKIIKLTLKNYKNINIKQNNIRTGDLLYFDEGDGKGIHHAAIITKIKKSDICYTAHSTSEYDKSISKYFKNKKQIIYLVVLGGG